jgi:hypothetical protein
MQIRIVCGPLQTHRAECGKKASCRAETIEASAGRRNFADRRILDETEAFRAGRKFILDSYKHVKEALTQYPVVVWNGTCIPAAQLEPRTTGARVSQCSLRSCIGEPAPIVQ